MRAICTTLSLCLCLISTSSAQAEDSEVVSPVVIEEMNQRYDDYFAHQRAKDRLDEQRQTSALEVKKQRQEHDARLEAARIEHLKMNPRRSEDERLRLQWEAEQAERREEAEMARRRFVRKQDRLEDLRRRGRTVPELKEYDLEGY